MNRSYFKWLVLLSIACAFLIVFFMLNQHFRNDDPISAPSATSQPLAPFTSYISALGIVEAGGGNIYIGSPLNRVVSQVDVVVGQKVKKGDILFQLNSSDLAADLMSKKFDYENAKANLKKLEALPRAEDITSATAEAKSAQVEFEQAKSQYQRVEGLQKNGAMSDEEVNRRRFAFENAESKLQQAQAILAKTKAGAWPPDLEIARLQVLQSKALMQRVETDIERTIIRSPSDATVLQIKIHEGEFPDSSRAPSMIIGNTDIMYLRVSINQFDVSYFNPDSPAFAYLQGNSKIGFPLKFVRVEPFLVAKQNINNDITEKIDTRVLQAIYSFDDPKNRFFINQQMNVFIETEPKHKKEANDE